LFLSLALFLSSCAIHAKFPYICFYSGCVKSQLGIDRLPGLKKRMKAKAQMKKRKAMAKNNKKAKQNDASYKKYSDPREETLAKDSLPRKTDSTYAFKCDSKLNLIKILIIRTPQGKDSLTYFLIEERNDISEDDKKNASNYLKVTGIQNISKVIIKDLLDKKEYGKHQDNIIHYRAKKIKRFLKNEGIDESVISAEP
jgi:hypothetical protein